MNPAHKFMRIPMPNRTRLHPLDGPVGLTTYRAIFGEDNAEAQTWKQQSGSLGHRTLLHGNELRLRSGCRQTGTAMKPFIICHMLSSVDGKIDGAALSAV